MELVERDGVLAELQSLALSAQRSFGRFAFLAGSAGVGKTTVVAEFSRRAPVAVMWGACDALSAPRALGPFHDMAVDWPAVAALLGGDPRRHGLLTGLLELLSTRPAVMILEDVHWADEATLDAIRFLARRIERTRSLCLATYRDDEVGPDHPLKVVLGQVATAPGHARLLLEPLTLAGVNALSTGHAVDPAHLHAISGGNPFYVTEVLAAPGWTVPPTVADAVLARAHRLSPDVRTVIETVAVDPLPTDRHVLRALDHAPEAIDAAVASGMLATQGPRVWFRHELGRLAVFAAIPEGRRRCLHRRLLETLPAGGADADRMAHHADGAGDDPEVLRWATRAGVGAADRGAHRQAEVHHAQAAEAASRLHARGEIDSAHLVEVLDAHATELAVLDLRSEAVTVRNRILDIAAELADAAMLAHQQTKAAHALWCAGEGTAARRLIARAVETAGSSGDDRAAAHALTWSGYIAMLARRGAEAVRLCTEALTIAESAGMDDLVVSARNALGAARICSFSDFGGIADLEQAARIAGERGWDGDRADALENLGSGLGEVRRYDLADRYLREAIAYSADRDLDGRLHYSSAWLARITFEQGRWDEVDRCTESIPTELPISPMSLIVTLTVEQRLNARRGFPTDLRVLRKAWELARQTGDLQRLWPVIAARAELSWLGAHADPTVLEDVGEVLDQARSLNVPWAIGEIAFWAWKLGLDPSVPDGAAAPFRLQMTGNHRAAANEWAALGCPYEAAWADADSDDTGRMLAAVEALHRMGAAPLAARVRKRLRDLDAPFVPVGPRSARVGHPADLTPRQAEVLELICAGLTDAQIAQRLSISTKTVGHHVSAVLTGLKVTNRGQAAAEARRRGLTGGLRPPTKIGNPPEEASPGRPIR